MLAALLLAGIIGAPLGSAGLFLPAHRRARASGVWPAVRRFVLAIVATLVLSVVVAAILKVIGVSSHNLVAGLAGLVAASIIWLPATRRWNARAHLCWGPASFSSSSI